MPKSRRQTKIPPREQLETRERAMEEIAEAYRSASEAHQWQQPKDLTQQQKRALNELEDAWEEVRQWYGDYPQDESERNYQLADQTRYNTSLRRAAWAGLWGHPILRAWLTARRSMGDWEELRRFRLGLETGVDKPMSKEDFWLAFELQRLRPEPVPTGHAQDLIDNEHRPKANRPEAIRKVLIDKLKDPEPEDLKRWRDYFDLHPEDVESLIARLEHSRQNFHKWLKRLRLI